VNDDMGMRDNNRITAACAVTIEVSLVVLIFLNLFRHGEFTFRTYAGGAFVLALLLAALRAGKMKAPGRFITGFALPVSFALAYFFSKKVWVAVPWNNEGMMDIQPSVAILSVMVLAWLTRELLRGFSVTALAGFQKAVLLSIGGLCVFVVPLGGVISRFYDLPLRTINGSLSHALQFAVVTIVAAGHLADTGAVKRVFLYVLAFMLASGLLWIAGRG